MRRKMLGSLILIFVFITDITPTFSQQQNKNDVVVESVNTGSINYSTGWIYAEGYAKIDTDQNKALAIRIATLDARRNLLEMIKRVPIDSNTQVNDLIRANDTIRTSIMGFIEGAERVGEPRYLRTEGEIDRNVIVVTVRMPLRLNNEILSEISPPSRLLPPLQEQSLPPQIQKSSIYSGVIIDARTFPVRPAMAPKILDEDGREVYGSANISRDYAVSQGMVGYTKSIDEAKSNPRVAGNPIIVKGINTSRNADIVISNEDARRIRLAASYQKFLDECRLMIVLQEVS